MTTLVTGVAGFIGSNFALYYLNKYPNEKIVGIDSLTYAGNIKNLDGIDTNRFMFLNADINDKHVINFVLKHYNVNKIINFAAESHVDRSIKDSSTFINSNIYGVVNLLNCFKDVLNEIDFRFLQVSTDEVYGSINKGKFSETTILHPNNPYAASKASADLFIQSYYNTYDFPGLISRCSNNYGIHQHDEKFIPTIIKKSINHQDIPVYGDGKQIRDWIHVLDHCSAVDCILHNGKSGEIYNVGADNEWANIDLIKLILYELQDITGDERINEDLITYVTDRPGHDKRYAMDATKLKSQFGWKPTIKFKNGLQNVIKWYLKF